MSNMFPNANFSDHGASALMQGSGRPAGSHWTRSSIAPGVHGQQGRGQEAVRNAGLLVTGGWSSAWGPSTWTRALPSRTMRHRGKPLTKSLSACSGSGNRKIRKRKIDDYVGSVLCPPGSLRVSYLPHSPRIWSSSATVNNRPNTAESPRFEPIARTLLMPRRWQIAFD